MDEHEMWLALDYVVNAGLVEGDTPEERMQSAIIETQYELHNADGFYVVTAPDKDIEEYVKAHYTP